MYGRVSGISKNASFVLGLDFGNRTWKIALWKKIDSFGTKSYGLSYWSSQVDWKQYSCCQRGCRNDYQYNHRSVCIAKKIRLRGRYGDWPTIGIFNGTVSGYIIFSFIIIIFKTSFAIGHLFVNCVQRTVASAGNVSAALDHFRVGICHYITGFIYQIRDAMIAYIDTSRYVVKEFLIRNHINATYGSSVPKKGCGDNNSEKSGCFWYERFGYVGLSLHCRFKIIAVGVIGVL